MRKKVVSVLDLKQRNQAAILSLLTQQRLSRADIGRALGLTRASVGEHIDQLMEAGRVYERGIGQIKRGRSPVLLDVVADFGFFAGIYLSRGACRFGLVDMKGGVINGGNVADAPDMNAKKVLEAAAEGILSLIKECRLDQEKLVSVGFSAPGPIDVKEGVILTPPGFSHWHGFDVAKQLKEILHRSIVIESNAASQAEAELRFGHGKRCKNFLMLLVDSGGIGGSIVIDGRRVTSTAGFGGEIGHASIKLDGRLCACGNSGCLERYAGISEILRESFSPQDGMYSWQQIVDSAERNDERCIEAIDREAHYLAAALVSYVNVLEPQAIILGGDLLYKPERLTASLNKALSSRAIMRSVHSVDVLPSAQKSGHHILSAVAPAFNRYYEEGL